MRSGICALVAGVLLGCGLQSEATVAADGASEPASAAEVVEALPLKRGYFVASDISCGEASNATVMLHDGDGINSSREQCVFDRIERTGDNTYATTETCSVVGGNHQETTRSTYEIESPGAYKAHNIDFDWRHAARHCPQSELPSPWRDNDLGEGME